MSHNVDPIDPQPFRKWCDERIQPPPKQWRHTAGELAGKVTVEELASELGLGDRRLYAWRFENKALEQGAVEVALDRAGYRITDVYPDLQPLDSGEKVPFRPYPGFRCKLSDDQLKVLHRFHAERGFAVKELARQVYEQVGYASVGAAEWGIRTGFRRLGLEVIRRHPTALPAARLCGKPTADGSPCRAFRFGDSDLCWQHTFPDLARKRALAATAARMGAVA